MIKQIQPSQPVLDILLSPQTLVSALNMASDPFAARSLKRKNVKGLALTAPPAKAANPSDGDSQMPGALGNSDNRTDTLEIGLEFKLDLRSEDLVVLKELGAGNGGTVSKVMHASTKVIMARKVKHAAPFEEGKSLITMSVGHPSRCQRKCSKTDCTRIAGWARLQLTVRYYILWSFPKRGQGHTIVHGVHGLRVA